MSIWLENLYFGPIYTLVMIYTQVFLYFPGAWYFEQSWKSQHQAQGKRAENPPWKREEVGRKTSEKAEKTQQKRKKISFLKKIPVSLFIFYIYIIYWNAIYLIGLFCNNIPCIIRFAISRLAMMHIYFVTMAIILQWFHHPLLAQMLDANWEVSIGCFGRRKRVRQNLKA